MKDKEAGHAKTQRKARTLFLEEKVVLGIFEGKNGGSRKDAKEGKDSFFSREGRALRLGVSRRCRSTWNLEPGTRPRRADP
jgi:hypothetical protein